MGCDLPDPADDVDDCFKFLSGLSRKLGEVQFFSRNRAVGHHGWARLENGKVVRAYAWAGETLWNQGALTEAERNLKLRCLTYTESSEVLGLAEREVLALNTERVVRLAAAGADPTVHGADLRAKESLAICCTASFTETCPRLKPVHQVPTCRAARRLSRMRLR
jgi:hypothetical protein